MKDEDKIKERLIQELVELRQRVTELEASEMKRKQAEEALQESEEKYRLLAESLLDLVYEFDLEGKFIYVNEAATHMFGYSKDEMLSDIRVQDTITEENKVHLRKAINDILKGKTTVGERTLIRKDGSKFIGEIHSGPIYKGKDVVGVRGILRDITKRKRAEEALHKSEKRFRDLADLLPEAVYEIDLDGNFTFANQRAFQLSGYSQEDLEGGLNALQMFIPEDRGRVRKNISRILAGEDLGFMEYTAQRKDGSTFPVVIHSAAIVHESKVVGLRGIIIDISGIKETERKVRTLSSAVEQSIDGIAIGDLEPKLLYVNETFARMHGYSAEEMIEMKGVNLHNEEQMGEYIRGMNQIKTQGSWIGEIDHIRKDGTSIPTYMSVTLLKDEKGKPTGMLAVCRDITERKKAEKTLREREAELVIKTNSLEEVNTALGVLLKRKDEDKTELEEKVVANVRELVVPFLEKLRKSPLDPQQVAYINILESNLNAIISPFLRTLSAKYVGLTPTEIQIANLIKEGKNTKEIGEVMTVSPRTIETHRKNIRRKLGIEKKKGNLRSHLLAFK